jgi:hypothetical protein
MGLKPAVVDMSAQARILELSLAFASPHISPKVPNSGEKNGSEGRTNLSKVHKAQEARVGNANCWATFKYISAFHKALSQKPLTKNGENALSPLPIKFKLAASYAGDAKESAKIYLL